MTNEESQLIELADATTSSIIKVIGVGGGGGNAVAQMYRDGIPEVRYLVANTDGKALDDNCVPHHLLLGAGEGAGGNPVIGRKFAEESVDKIIAELDDTTRMVFITAGMGNGTGTGASPVIAREARKKGILTVGVVTLPFEFEGNYRINKALAGLDALAKETDAMLVINNERLREIYSDLNVINAFKKADAALSNAVRAIMEIISMHGYMNLDFQDARMVLKDGGLAVMSSGVAEGDNRVERAIEQAFHSPLLNNKDVYHSDRLIMAITSSSKQEQNMGISELDEVAAFMQRFNPNIITKYGLKFDDAMGDKVKVTILASGFGLYKKRHTELELQTDNLNDEIIERVETFYGGKSKKARHKPHIYIFTQKDLQNNELIAEIEDVPTRYRTSRQLDRLHKVAQNA